MSNGESRNPGLSPPSSTPRVQVCSLEFYMRLLTPLAAAAAFALAAPAFAQTTPPAPPAAPAAAPTTSPEEAAMEAKGQAFEAVMNQMNAELEAILKDESKSAEAVTTETNAVLDRHTADITTFAREVETFIKAEAAKPEHAAQKDEMIAGAAQAHQAIASIPGQIRTGVQQALAARAAAPARPQ